MSARLAGGQDGRLGLLLIAPLAERDATIEMCGAELVVACMDGVRPYPYVTTFVRTPALGRRHWSGADLTAVARRAVPYLRSRRHVVVHCENGCSRSVIAAAAILVELGTHTPADALAACRGDRPPSPTAIGSYWAFVHGREGRS